MNFSNIKYIEFVDMLSKIRAKGYVRLNILEIGNAFGVFGQSTYDRYIWISECVISKQNLSID